jgi:hypothetical protein
MNDIPEWLRPYLKQDSYNPPKQDITNLILNQGVRCY